MQIREVYQSLIDERQNEIMKLLTIVTTIVLPLSLVAGWYGMNFTNMPELTWHYGYGFIILLSIVITILNILYLSLIHISMGFFCVDDCFHIVKVVLSMKNYSF